MEILANNYYSKTSEEFVVYLAPGEITNILDIKSSELLDRLFKRGEKVFLLQGSGFSMDNQMQRWLDGYKESFINGEPIEIIKKRLIEQTMSDVAGFYFEYISEHDIFPFDLEIIEDLNGNKTVFATKYRETLKNITRKDEREGALFEGIDKAVEMIIDSEPNTVVFLTSPDGWSGLGYQHPDTQTYVYWIDKNGDLKAMTLRTNINLDENEKLIGINNLEQKNTKERIKNVVSSPFKIRVVDDGFLEVLNRIEEKTGEKFEKLRSEITHRDIYNSLTSDENREVGKLLSDLKDFLTNNINEMDESSFKILAFSIGKCVLDIKEATNKRKQKFNEAIVVTGYDSQEIKYQVLSREVQQLLGCNGGGMMVGMKASLNKEGWVWKPGTCRPKPEGCGQYKNKVGPCDICEDCQNEKYGG